MPRSQGLEGREARRVRLPSASAWSPGSPPQPLRRVRACFAPVCTPRDQPRGARSAVRRVGKEGCPRGVRGRGLCRAPAPPTRPARQAAGGGGGGSGRGDSAGGEELRAGSGRHRHLRGRHQGRAALRCQPCLPGLRAVCVLRLSAAAPREGCWVRARRGVLAGHGGPGFQPLRVTLHKALLLSRPQFPHWDRESNGGPFLTELRGRPKVQAPDGKGPDGHCLHRPPRSPWVWPASPDRPPCGLSAPPDPCGDSPPPNEKQEVGTPLGPY